jgi:hypothetical protein
MTAFDHVSLVSLGVRDLPRARSFYERLGFAASRQASNEAIVFFQLANMVLGLYGREPLLEDMALPDADPSPGGMALAINLQSEDAVDAVIEQARAAGATILKPPQKVFWGGYSGYFADPDGHPWEVAYNPFFPLEKNGRPLLPE